MITQNKKLLFILLQLLLFILMYFISVVLHRKLCFQFPSFRRCIISTDSRQMEPPIVKAVNWFTRFPLTYLYRGRKIRFYAEIHSPLNPI